MKFEKFATKCLETRIACNTECCARMYAQQNYTYVNVLQYCTVPLSLI